MPATFFKKRKKLSIFLFFVTFILFFIYIFSRGPIYEANQLKYGVTFSKQKMDELGIDWKSAYIEMLDDLGVKNLRLSAYWNEIENEKGLFNFSYIDWQLQEADARNVKVILAIGGRLPRWPECHFPEWVKNAPAGERESSLLSYLQKTIERYKDNKNIIAWQIENEPFLNHFGDCPTLNRKFLDQEIALAKKLDSRPIVVTDSGEISIWYHAAKRADIFGTTMYRDTYSDHLKKYIHYPIGPSFFRFKKNIVNLFAHPKDWIVIELQAEPWCTVSYQNATIEEREKTMSHQKFIEMIEFARKTGFQTFYLWGIEYWYWEKKANNDPRIWDEVKYLIGNSELK